MENLTKQAEQQNQEFDQLEKHAEEVDAKLTATKEVLVKVRHRHPISWSVVNRSSANRFPRIIAKNVKPGSKQQTINQNGWPNETNVYILSMPSWKRN